VVWWRGVVFGGGLWHGCVVEKREGGESGCTAQEK
jgi:hypothetical protein